MSIKVMTLVWESGPDESTQRFVLLAIADNARDDGSHAWPSVKELACKCAISERTVIRAIDALIADGYLLRRRRKDTTNMYQVVLDRLRSTPVSDKMTLTVHDKMSLTVGDTVSSTQVTDDHPGKCQPVTYDGDTVSPDPSFNHQSNRQDDPSTAAETEPPPSAAAVPDIIPDLLRWIGFSDRLNDRERAMLDPPTLLAWVYWIHLEQAKPTPPKNAVALARSQWRKGLRPRDDFLALARCWLAMPTERRRVLLDGCDFAARYGGEDPALGDEFPGVPVSAAVAVYRATDGELGPPSLMPPVNLASGATAVPAAPPTRAATSSDLWNDALRELKHQMDRATFQQWLQGTTAALAGDELTVYVRNNQAVAWLTERLHPVIAHTVADVAGRPISVRYKVPEAT